MKKQKEVFAYFVVDLVMGQRHRLFQLHPTEFRGAVERTAHLPSDLPTSHPSHTIHNAVRNLRYTISQPQIAPSTLIRLKASQELQDAFNTLVSSPSQRGLLATIKNETLIPTQTLPAKDDFLSDLNSLAPLLSPNEATYILLKQDGNAADGYIAVTYVPDTANVRQKMLFASTRLTLVRELGVERFRETVFVTSGEELTPKGWERHERHNRLDAPLTEEEAGLKHIKDAEAEESGGTGARKSHVSAGISLNMGDEVGEALEGLKDAPEGALVMIVRYLDPSRHEHKFSDTPNRKSTLRQKPSTSTPPNNPSNPPPSVPRSRPPNPATRSTATQANKASSSCTAAQAKARLRNAWSTLLRALSSLLWLRMQGLRSVRGLRLVHLMSGLLRRLLVSFRSRRLRVRGLLDLRDREEGRLASFPL